MRRRQIEQRQRAGAERLDFRERLRWFPSRTRPLEPTQIAPEFSTTGSSAAASPPVMGSLALPRATRFETTTRFTGPLLLKSAVLTDIHQYGS